MIKDRIKELRKENNLTQSALAKIINMSQDTVSDWERGVSTPSAENLILLCKKFAVSADYILELENYDGTKNY